jgi:hypothetical protein
MLISHRHQFIYTKTVKTAGTSVEIYLEEACIPPGCNVARSHAVAETVTEAGVIGYRDPAPGASQGPECRWYNHMPARDIRTLIGHQVWDSYFKFCVIRNPFDKLVSLFWWLIIRPRLHNPDAVADFSAVRAEFSSWCLQAASATVDRDKYLIDGQVAMDYFIRYESLLRDLEQVCDRVSFPFRPDLLGHYKGGIRASTHPFADYYDPPAARAVRAAFGWELDYFGYVGPSEEYQNQITCS